MEEACLISQRARAGSAEEAQAPSSWSYRTFPALAAQVAPGPPPLQQEPRGPLGGPE